MVLYTLGPTLPPQNLSSQNLSSQNVLTPQQADRILKRYRPLLLTEKNGTWVPRRKMVFTWQAPVMFMAYAVCGFLGGLTVLVCTPLIEWGGGWGEGETVSLCERESERASQRMREPTSECVGDVERLRNNG